MKTHGFDRHLYILPFDHRGSFQTKLFGWSGDLSPDQIAQISSAKQVIYDGFRAAVDQGLGHADAGILVDEEFGAELLDDARARGFITACPAEKSGQAEFDFQYGEAFADHIERFLPTLCKVLVRYNADGNQAVNARQASRLRRLSDYLRNNSRSRFMFELLVPPEKGQQAKPGAGENGFDLEHRPRLTAQAIKELQDAGVEPDVWKIEGLDRHEDCERVVAAVRRQGRDSVGCIVLGRGEDMNRVRAWLAVASRVDGFIGFAVGRTTFWDSLVKWRDGSMSRPEAVEEIASRYLECARTFDRGAPDETVSGSLENASRTGARL
ncbi:MAG TPA: DUF2090 domain-containing protein [Bryobacteraceae bacterium]|nr:DUF2090 domain-containing protein [Bryobacteraceae bacterium]